MKINDKVKILKKGNGNAWNEIGRGICKGIAEGKNSIWIYFTDRDWPQDLTELINTNAPCIKVIKW